MRDIMSKVINIDVVSDTVCPWCFIGKRRLEAAIGSFKEKHGSVDFNVKWHPYQLNPTAPEEGIVKKKFYEEKFGPQASQMIARMKDTFAKEGLQYTVDGLTGNTFNSHRLISHAGKLGLDKQDRLVEELFKAYFTEAKYINDRTVLLNAAQNAGIANAEKVLDDETIEAAEVKAEVNENKRRINGVPNFVINQQFSLSGAQDPDTFISLFEETGV